MAVMRLTPSEDLPVLAEHYPEVWDEYCQRQAMPKGKLVTDPVRQRTSLDDILADIDWNGSGCQTAT